LQLADKIDASIDILHVVPPRTEGLDYPVLVATATQQHLDIAGETLKKFVDTSLHAIGQGLKNAPMISSSLEIGMPVQRICDTAQREDTSIIVIGSRGENRSRMEKFLGSVAAGVVEKAKCAVIVVPEDLEFSPIEQMTYATDVKDADPFEIWKALDLLQPFKPSVDLVHINLKKEGDLKAWEKMEKMQAFFKEKSSELEINFHHIPGKNVQKELSNFVEEHPTDLLVMYRPPHDFWDRLFYKSYTKQMALHTSVPLLVIKNE